MSAPQTILYSYIDGMYEATETQPSRRVADDGFAVMLLSRAARSLGYVLVRFEGYSLTSTATPEAQEANRDALQMIAAVARQQAPDDMPLPAIGDQAPESVIREQQRQWLAAQSPDAQGSIARGLAG